MQSLAVRYRPHKFEDVTSQSSIIKILNRQLETGQIKNCYLFCGASGCGKTTIARIFADELNNHVGEPIEIDGASNNGVENVKQIIKSAKERSIDGKYKIYIIDECHALSNQAWQALLKTVEEPPAFTIFIFCTTDPQKIPATILNRCMRFNFTRIASDKIEERLSYICQNEGYTNYKDACNYISRTSNGGMRDAIATLEKCVDYSTDLDINNVIEALGSFSYDIQFDLINNIIDGNEKGVLEIINKIYNQGSDMRLFVSQFLLFCLDVDKYLLFNDCSVTSIPSTMEEKLKSATNFNNSKDYYNYIINKLLELKHLLKDDSEAKSTIEVVFINMTRLK